MNAQHSMLSDDHGTPPEFVAIARAVLGIVDLDPTSSEKWNRTICATRIITAEQNALVTPWFEGAPAPSELVTDRRVAPAHHIRGRTFCNFPNDKRGKLVARLWTTLVEYYFRGWVTCAVYVGFSVEQLSRLQRVGARAHPLVWPTCIPRSRHNYLDGDALELQEDAPHASFLTLLSRDRDQVERFTAFASELGTVVNGDRW
jgi:hypothetical protein